MSRRRNASTHELLRHEMRGGWDVPDLTEPILARVHARRPFLNAGEQRRIKRLRQAAGFVVSALVVSVSVAIFSPGAFTSASKTLAAGLGELQSRWEGPVVPAQPSQPNLPMVLAVNNKPLPMSIVPTRAEQAVAVAFAEKAITIAKTVVNPSSTRPSEPGTVRDLLSDKVEGSEAATPR